MPSRRRRSASRELAHPLEAGLVASAAMEVAGAKHVDLLIVVCVSVWRSAVVGERLVVVL